MVHLILAARCKIVVEKVAGKVISTTDEMATLMKERIFFFFERAGDRTAVFFFATFEHVCCASSGLVLLYSIVLVCNVALSVYAVGYAVSAITCCLLCVVFLEVLI